MPEQSESLPYHLSVANKILFSKRTIKKIRQIVNGRYCTISAGYPIKDDIKLAMHLGYPLLGGDPLLNKSIMSQNCYKRFLDEEVGLPVAPYICNIQRSEEIVTRLATLIADNPHFDRWVFKIDGETQGRGIAYLDLNTIKQFKYLKSDFGAKNKQAKNALDFRKDSKESQLYNKLTQLLLRKLPSKLQIVRRGLYEGFQDYIDQFCAKGGMIEASPGILQKEIGAPAISFLLEPDGKFQILGTYEKICTGLMTPTGFELPQRSLPDLNVKFLFRD